MASTAAEALRGRLLADPRDFDAHVGLIATLSAALDTAGAAEELRLARLAMHAVFPMDESMWAAWLEEESKGLELASSEDQDAVLRLHAEACDDYLSPALWVRYLQVAQAIAKQRKSPPEEVRWLFKEAMRYCGAHYTRGELVWNAWVAFEEQVGGDAAYVKTRRAQAVLANAHLYGNADAIAAAEARRADEERVVAARGTSNECAGSAEFAYNTELLGAWLASLDHERTRSGPKKQLGYLYERALADCCLAETLWIRHLTALETLGDPQLWVRVAKRAVRNVSLSGWCWGSLVRAHEAAGLDFEAAKNAAVSALRGSARVADAVLAYCAAVQRSGGDVWAAVGRAVEDFSSLPEDDPVIRARQWQCRLALERQNREVFSQAWAHLHKLRPRAVRLWVEHLEQVRQWGGDDSKAAMVRAVFTDALNRLQGDLVGFDTLAGNWLDFESQQGSLSDFSKAQLTIESKRPSRAGRPAQANLDEAPVAKVKELEAAAVAESKMKKAFPEHKKSGRKQASGGEASFKVVAAEAEMEEEEDGSGKNFKRTREAASGTAGGGRAHPGNKRARNSAADDTLFVSSLEATVDEAALRALFQPAVESLGASIREVRLKWKRASKDIGETTGFAYVELEGQNKASAALDLVHRFHQHVLNGRPISVQISHPPAAKPGDMADGSHASRRRKKAGVAATAGSSSQPSKGSDAPGAIANSTPSGPAEAPVPKKKPIFLPRAVAQKMANLNLQP